MVAKITVYMDNWSFTADAEEPRTVTDVYEGENYDATVNQDHLIVVEQIPDVGNKNKGNPTAKIRAIYNTGNWDKVTLDD